jgi:hypothetical protein
MSVVLPAGSAGMIWRRALLVTLAVAAIGAGAARAESTVTLGGFTLICRDSGNGYGMEGATSRYRRVELIDTSAATNIAGGKYDGLEPVAPKGRLVDGIVPAARQIFIDLNDNAELARFGLHNGAPQDHNNLSEKWESMGLVPALDPAHPRDVFLFIANDNDFITQHGFQAGARYADKSGVELDTMFLVFRVTLPASPR